jgi:Fic family protein
MFEAPVLNEQELAVIRRIEGVKKSLKYAVRDVPHRWQGLLRRNTFARNIRGSNSIEGYNVSMEDAIAAADGEEPLDADEVAWAAVVCYREAMTYIVTLSDDPHFRYSTDLIRGLHYMMLKYDLAKNSGRWRPGPVSVYDEELGQTVYEGPDADMVPDLMGKLADYLNANGDVPPMVLGAMAHLNLVMIHPFSDGNGRMARGLQSLVLARTGTIAPPFSSIEEYLGRKPNTRAYYDVLGEVGDGSWQPRRDSRPWVRFCLNAHFVQATTLLRRSREMERLWNMLEIELKKAGLPERLLLATADAALGFRVRNATYRSVADITQQAASRDLKLAADAGFLEAHGERRGRFYKATARVLEIRGRTREPREMPDPFQEASPDELYLPGLQQ